jgi:hypothetical protein
MEESCGARLSMSKDPGDSLQSLFYFTRFILIKTYLH